jgi:hypothetical protein
VSFRRVPGPLFEPEIPRKVAGRSNIARLFIAPRYQSGIGYSDAFRNGAWIPPECYKK